MRLSLLSLLLLGVASPALAADPTPDESAPRMERERAPRAEPEYRSRSVDARPRTSDRAERSQRVEVRETRPEPIRDIAATAAAQPRGEGRDRSPGSAEGRRPSAGSGSAWRERGAEREHRNRGIPPAAGSPVYGSTLPSPGTVIQPSREVSTGTAAAGGNLRDRIAAEGLRRQRIESAEWRRDWRNDRRYDWRRYRDRDRSRFHLGIYIDPFGWNYRNWDIGWRLPTRYYASQYWINDPYYYRLPPVGGPYRWIRYHGDVLLVDLRSGRVLDRIPNFFW